MGKGVFISYRRSDSAAFAGRIADYFAHRYPDIAVFFDATSIEPGEDFVASIERRLEDTAVVLAPIGDEWLDARDAVGGRRIDNPDDFVRRELSTALARGVRVVPVLLDGASMPPVTALPDELAALGRCNAQLMRHAAFARDVEHLGEFVTAHLARLDSAASSGPSGSGTAGRAGTREALVAAFETFGADWAPGTWMICETRSGSFVQFLRTSVDRVVLDLPVGPLDPTQRLAARRLVTEDHGGADAEGVALQLVLPLQPSYLARLTLDVFRRVFGADDRALTVTLAGNGIEPVVLPIRPEHGGERGSVRGPPAPEVLAALEAAFTRFVGEPGGGFVVVENPYREIVQFARTADADAVVLDLPTHGLGPRQIVAARRELEIERGARRVDPTDDGDFSYQLELPAHPGRLAALTVELFEQVYGRRTTAPLTVERGTW